MGGDRETFLESEKPAASKPGAAGSVESTAGNRLRIHENAGEVHIHDDVAHLKCAIPVAEWWKAWEKLRHPSTGDNSWFWVDTANNTQVRIETLTTIDASSVMHVENKISIWPIVVGANYKELHAFTKRK